MASYATATVVVNKPGVSGVSQKLLPGPAGSAAALKELKVQVQITEQDSKQPAHCKSDGMRFAGADTTVKLRQDASYIINISITPAVAISVSQAEVKHRQAECQEPSTLCCCLPQADAYSSMSEEMEWSQPIKAAIKERPGVSGTSTSSTRAAFELPWTCDMELSRRGLRGELALDVAVQEFGLVTLPIMAKVYAHSDSSATHGMPLHSINYTYGRSGLTGEVKLYSVQYNK